MAPTLLRGSREELTAYVWTVEVEVLRNGRVIDVPITVLTRIDVLPHVRTGPCLCVDVQCVKPQRINGLEVLLIVTGLSRSRSSAGGNGNTGGGPHSHSVPDVRMAALVTEEMHAGEGPYDVAGPVVYMDMDADAPMVAHARYERTSHMWTGIKATVSALGVKQFGDGSSGAAANRQN
jgi:hypothetical protein